MTTVLVILAVFAVGGFLLSKFSGENNSSALGSAAAGAFMGGSCIIQLLIPVFFLLAGLWLFNAIFG